MILGGVEGAVQSVAGFASLHCAITLLVALMVQYTIRSRVLHWIFWTNFVITIVATLYFGWHYVADDVAGILIALIAFYVGGIASGQKFERHGLVVPPADDAPPSRRPRRRRLSPRSHRIVRDELRRGSAARDAHFVVDYRAPENYKLVVRQADTPVTGEKIVKTVPFVA